MGPTRWEQPARPSARPEGLRRELAVCRREREPRHASARQVDEHLDFRSGQALPQHVELAWKSPQSFNTVLLTFDTNTGRRENLPLFRYPDCVKDYDLQARSAARGGRLHRAATTTCGGASTASSG